ncbi:MAG TPA: DUF5658 family protein [Bryobacteraceae bacterium]|jgi:hypothetical protein|nr:DUF5658 family protein [Bryobacteraceae bacterium]
MENLSGDLQIKQMSVTHIFIYLQLLDLLTTLIGIRLGAAEASPFIRVLMHLGPAFGVVVSKIFALGLGALCIQMKKQYLIRWISYWYGCLVVWNLMVMLTVPQAG